MLSKILAVSNVFSVCTSTSNTMTCWILRNITTKDMLRMCVFREIDLESAFAMACDGVLQYIVQTSHRNMEIS